jgi:dTDP-4-dehydrorhamnose reductase
MGRDGVKALILGASGIIGQHLRAMPQPGIEPFFCSRSDRRSYEIDLNDQDALEHLLVKVFKPHVVVNLAGESNVDTVEKDPAAYERINVGLPYALARLTEVLGFRLIHISSQAVFRGTEPAYGLNARLDPVNAYGRQKADAETAVLNHQNVTVIRPTFVLGIRPDPTLGRQNPIEAMLSGQKNQVHDRWFSPSFAPDVAACIWDAVKQKPDRRVIQAGVPVRVSRYLIARNLGLNVEPVSHRSFVGLAPRPMDTTYACGEHVMTYEEGLADCVRRWHDRSREKAA